MNHKVHTAFVILLTFIMVSCNTPSPYQVWREQAKTNIRLLPEYGNVQKNKQQLAADSAFLKEATKEETAEKASEMMVQLGFKHLNQGDRQTAMYRFNQAWLLNPQNAGAYWGFGSVYFSFQDYKNAIAQYNKGLKLDPRNKDIVRDRIRATESMR